MPAPIYVTDTGQTQVEANSDTFSFTLTPSTAEGLAMFVHYWSPSWTGGINSCSFDSVAGFRIHNADEHDGGYSPIRQEVWAILNLTQSTAAKTFKAACNKTYHGVDARISTVIYSGCSIDSSNFYTNDTTTEDASTSISVTTPADSATAIMVWGVAKTATSLTGDTAETYKVKANANGWGFHGRAVGSSAATTFIQDGDHASRILFSAQVLPPQNLSVDVSGSPATLSGTIRVGAVDDGNISITADKLQAALSITATVIEREPISADMHMYS